MKPGVLRKLLARPEWQLRLQLLTRHPRIRGCYANGFGTEPLVRCARWQTGRAVLSGPRVLSVQAKPKRSPRDRYAETYPLASIVRYDFPTRRDMPPVKFTWYDGGLMPPRPQELDETRSFRGGNEDDEGLLFVGDRGKILCGFHGDNPKLIPQAKTKSSKKPPKTLPRIPL